MTIEEAIVKFKVIVNRNLTGQNLDADHPRIIVWLNDSLREYANHVIKNERNSDNIDAVNVLLKEAQIKRTKKTGDTQIFKLPESFIRVESVVGLGKKGNCQDEIIRLVPTKTRDKSITGSSANLKARWIFREAFYTISEEAIKIVAPFNIESVTAEYYREPRSVSIEGWLSPDGTTTKTVQFEFNSTVVEKIVNMAAAKFINSNKTIT